MESRSSPSRLNTADGNRFRGTCCRFADFDRPMEDRMDYQFGPRLEENGVTFRLWAPSASAIDVELNGGARAPMSRREDGFWQAFIDGVGPGAVYRFDVDGKAVPDIASRA